MTEIELIKPHRHAGRDYAPGQKIRLAPHKADWLIAKGVAKVPAPGAATTTKAKE